MHQTVERKAELKLFGEFWGDFLNGWYQTTTADYRVKKIPLTNLHFLFRITLCKKMRVMIRSS